MHSTNVEFLKQIAGEIPDVLELGTGHTGYLDRPVHPTASVTKGVDAHGRVFVTLCARFYDPLDKQCSEGKGIITIFQRYNDNADVVAQADNHNYVKFLHGAATEDDLHSLEKLITFGRTTVERSYGNVMVELVSPEEALAE